MSGAQTMTGSTHPFSKLLPKLPKRAPVFQSSILPKLYEGTRHSLTMLAKFRQFLAAESGATAIEYSLIASGIALAIIATVYGIGPKLNTIFSSVSTQLN
jgi:pilus assembly protein Flp/PilA